MTRGITLIVALIGLGAFAVPGRVRAPQAGAARLALTFDDLPFANVGGGTYLPAAQRTTSAILRTLERHHAFAVGFVNERQLDTADRPARIALLKQWVDAGMTLGNHTYSHPDLNTTSIEAFRQEIVRGERTILALRSEKALPILFFRHPMTHTGDTPEKKAAIEAFLASRNYTIAPHTIENSDFIFNAVYVRARDGNDPALAARVREAYIEFTFAATAFAEKAAPQIFGRQIPHTILLHANVLNADALDDLLTRYRKRRYNFLRLEHVIIDEAYATKDRTVSAYGPTWLWRWNSSLGKDVSFKDDPEPPAWVVDAFNRR